MTCYSSFSDYEKHFLLKKIYRNASVWDYFPDMQRSWTFTRAHLQTNDCRNVLTCEPVRNYVTSGGPWRVNFRSGASGKWPKRAISMLFSRERLIVSPRKFWLIIKKTVSNDLCKSYICSTSTSAVDKIMCTVKKDDLIARYSFSYILPYPSLLWIQDGIQKRTSAKMDTQF